VPIVKFKGKNIEFPDTMDEKGINAVLSDFRAAEAFPTDMTKPLKAMVASVVSLTKGSTEAAERILKQNQELIKTIEVHPAPVTYDFIIERDADGRIEHVRAIPITQSIAQPGIGIMGRTSTEREI